MSPVSQIDDTYFVGYSVRHGVRHRAKRRVAFQVDERVWLWGNDAGTPQWRPAGSCAVGLLAGKPDSQILWDLLSPLEPQAWAERQMRQAAVFCRSLIKAVRNGQGGTLSPKLDDDLIRYWLRVKPLPLRMSRVWDQRETTQTFVSTPETVLVLSTWFGLLARRLRRCERCHDPFLRPNSRSRRRLCPDCSRPLEEFDSVMPRASQLNTDEARRQWRLFRARTNQRAHRAKEGGARPDAPQLTAAARQRMVLRAFADLKRKEAGRMTNAAWEAKWGKGAQLPLGRPLGMLGALGGRRPDRSKRSRT